MRFIQERRLRWTSFSSLRKACLAEFHFPALDHVFIFFLIRLKEAGRALMIPRADTVGVNKGSYLGGSSRDEIITLTYVQ